MREIKEYNEYDAHKAFGKSDEWVQALREIDEVIKETRQRINAGEEVIKSSTEQLSNLKSRLKHFNKTRERFLQGKPFID